MPASHATFSVARIAALSILLGLLPMASIASGQQPAGGEAIRNAKALSRAFRSSAEKMSPSVVTIVAKVKTKLYDRGDLREMLKDPRFRELFPKGELPFEFLPEEDDGEKGPSHTEDQIGSGIIIDAAGVVLTNSHVVQHAEKVIVRLADGREFPAQDMKTDPLSDLAVLRIQGGGKLTPAVLGDSDKLEIGDWVIAIGSPFELEATVSAGIVSGKGRSIAKIRRGKLLQTDAAINPGNSGGPLVNLDGEVVGVNTAIATNNGGYQGIGFAIPINRAKWIAEQLQKHGEVRRAYMGIRIDVITPQTAKRLGVPVRGGVLVVNVASDSPAAAAGLRADDVIVEFAGAAVRSPRDLQDVVEQKPLDSKQPVKIIRQRMRITLQVGVEALPATVAVPEERP